MVALDPSHDRGVALTSPNAFGAPTVALVNLRNGAVDQFTGVGTGTVAGVAVDPNTGIACTTTSIDYSLEFYNLAKHTGFAQPVPGIGGQINAPAAVAVDSLHGLFVVTQPRLSTQAHTSSVLVYDEKGDLVEEIDGFDYMPVNPGLAINPRQRIGYVTLVNPNEFPLVNLLQKFSYEIRPLTASRYGPNLNPKYP